MMKTKIIIMLLAMLIVISGCTGAVTGTATAEVAPPTEPEVVMLGLENGRYTPDPIMVEQGKEVVLKNDGSLAGCALNTMSPELGINANFMKDPEYRFTPEKKGTYTITCSMGMFKGTVIVQ